MSKEKVLSLLPNLTQDDLTEVRAIVDSLLKGAVGADTTAPTSGATLVFNAISRALNGPTGAVHLGAMPANLQTALNDRISGLIDFFNCNFKGWDKNKTIQLAFLGFMMKLLRDNLSAIGIKPTYLTMTRNLHRMGEVFEDAFPSYLWCGLGHLILKKLKTK